jgi:hypothetical protein
MSESLKIAFTAVLGVAVFVVGQLIQKLFIEPIQDQKKAIGEILYVIDYYFSLNGGISPDTEKDARKYLTRAASHLYRSTTIIPAYRLLSMLRIVPKDKVIKAVKDHAINLAHDINYDTLNKYHRAIREELNIKEV